MTWPFTTSEVKTIHYSESLTLVATRVVFILPNSRGNIFPYKDAQVDKASALINIVCLIIFLFIGDFTNEVWCTLNNKKLCFEKTPLHLSAKHYYLRFVCFSKETKRYILIQRCLYMQKYILMCSGKLCKASEKCFEKGDVLGKDFKNSVAVTPFNESMLYSDIILVRQLTFMKRIRFYQEAKRVGENERCFITKIKNAWLSIKTHHSLLPRFYLMKLNLCVGMLCDKTRVIATGKIR